MATDYPQTITEEAQEVAKNWFYKIMSISEVIPRFYIQCAFMKFHEYHTEFKTVDTFDILSATVRGMGNPLLAAYSRMFFLKCIGSSGDTNVGNMNISFQRDFNSSSKPI